MVLMLTCLACLVLADERRLRMCIISLRICVILNHIRLKRLLARPPLIIEAVWVQLRILHDVYWKGDRDPINQEILKLNAEVIRLLFTAPLIRL